MTREEEINNASYAYWVNNYANIEFIDEEEKELHTQDIQESFINGAEWADKHPHWISVEDELPKDYEPVLAAFANHFARVCFNCGKTWYLNKPLAAEEMEGITHWMPLPAPPSCSEIPNNHKKGGER